MSESTNKHVKLYSHCEILHKEIFSKIYPNNTQHDSKMPLKLSLEKGIKYKINNEHIDVRKTNKDTWMKGFEIE